MIDYISRLPDRGLPFPRAVAVMGSTGSIGVNTLAVMAENAGRFTAAALAGGRNAALLAAQAAEWRPPHLAVLDEETRHALTPLLPAGYRPAIHVGPQGYAVLAALPDVRLVVSAQVGAAGLAATWAAVTAGKTVALANKESLVLAGTLLRREAARTGAVILPVDSEHNALFQCLTGQDTARVSRLILTASGGPFRGRNAAFLQTVTPAMALTHPNWSMGAKITIDSATMMNKGLEIIEACHLYGLPLEAVDVLVHPQSIVHSLAAFADGSLLAQAGPPDMRIAISHCLGWPERIANGVPPFDLSGKTLTFEHPDLSVFRCLALARDAMRIGNGMPVVLNAANELAVDAFLSGKLSFASIAQTIEAAMNRHMATPMSEPTTIDAVMDLDRETRRVCREALP